MVKLLSLIALASFLACIQNPGLRPSRFMTPVSMKEYGIDRPCSRMSIWLESGYVIEARFTDVERDAVILIPGQPEILHVHCDGGHRPDG